MNHNVYLSMTQMYLQHFGLRCDIRGQRESREDRVERGVSVAELGCMSGKESVEGRADKIEEVREEAESKR